MNLADSQGKIIIPNTFCEACITLIQKSNQSSVGTENYRPVSLMNVDAKIFSKMVVN
jgi:hypothetical protein